MGNIYKWIKKLKYFRKGSLIWWVKNNMGVQIFIQIEVCDEHSSIFSAVSCRVATRLNVEAIFAAFWWFAIFTLNTEKVTRARKLGRIQWAALIDMSGYYQAERSWVTVCLYAL